MSNRLSSSPDEIRGPGQNDTRTTKTLSSGEKFSIPPNTIAFVMTKEKFRLPEYMAMRFDLKISNAHRGILRGSGPLVDPGFEGKLFVPLHNLTTNEYDFCEGETFIWVEFTKVSPNQQWDKTLSLAYHKTALLPYPHLPFEDKVVPFPPRKKNLNEFDYLTQASPYAPIRSSIAYLVADAKAAAESEKKRVRVWEFSAVVGVFALIVAIWGGLFQWVADFRNNLASAQVDTRDLKIRTEDQISQLEKELASINSQIQQLDAQLQHSPTTSEPQTRRR